jgi:crotonobetainyl-CoA:carnitine CoA-transferase CaiB-like acyl-CoA transferase
MERFDLLEDESLLVPLNWQARFPEVRAALAEWVRDKPKREVYHAAQELRIAITPVNTMADLVSDPQLAAREFFGAIAAGDRTLLAPGAPYRFSRTPCELSARASEKGADTEAVAARGTVWANEGVRYPAPGAARPAAGPLEGIRVIEVTANWAGPQAGRLMADLGADVIKVELATKPATRALQQVGNDIWPNFYHRAGYFNKQNRNKRAFCLDLSDPAGRQVFLDLVKRSDVVLENNAARVMGQLGVDYEALKAVNPRIVMCSMSGFGGTGPERNYSAYGSNIETSCGLASVLGYGPGEYFGTGTFYADPVTGNHGAVAIMAALLERERSGQGQWIDMALLECAIPLFAQPFLEYQVTGEIPEPRGNRSLIMWPQNVYRAAGTDCWLAVSVRDSADWQALCRVIGRPELGNDAGLQNAEGRRARCAEIDAAITAWSRAVDHISAADELQAAGVPAAPVMPNWEIASDNHLHDRGFFVDVRHPVAGTHRFPGFPWRLQKTPGTMRRHAPMFAEHNRDVFAGILGMDDAAIAALYERGVTADGPMYQAGPAL